MADEKELAYRYDLFVAPDWRDRFDVLVNETVELPVTGRILEVNCGTGASALDLAARLGEKGDVVGVDPVSARLALARAKALIQKLTNVTFEQGIASDLPFTSHEFDAVIGDASMAHTDEIEDILSEMIRVASPEGRVVLKLSTRGSFDEFFSIYWEALLMSGIVDEVWPALERMINERLKVSDVEEMAQRAGLREVQIVSRKEEFTYENADEFLESPIFKDVFLAEWLEIVPESQRADIRQNIKEIIERERHGASFDISIKATLLSGLK
jgi:ubiquinone/menaquinone biosynthesis C-methylase UbiE